MITPRTLKGFRDYPPAIMIPREAMMDTARRVFRSFGFAPIDTPVLEYLQILTGKGSEETDRQIYNFTTRGGREVAMRFDLTVPLARFAAQHINALGTPFRRYHIAPVWRGENPQSGRYREFVQCDFDTIGTESAVSDTEVIMVVNRLLNELGFDEFTISINNRMVLSGLLEKLDLIEKTTDVLRCLDKIGKIGREAVAKEMVDSASVTSDQANQVLALSDLDDEPESVLDSLLEIVSGSETGVQGVERLGEVYRSAIASGVSPERLRLDVSIARGLDYYTGTIFETTLDELPGIGSICSGGRYDNLASLYTKQRLPGIGGSLGLDRLLAAMEQLKLLPSQSVSAPTMIAYFDKSLKEDYLKMSSQLRSAGLGIEMYPDPKRLAAQLKYADQKGFSHVIIAGDREWQNGEVQVKTLATKESHTIAYQHDAFEELARFLGSTIAESE
ncbi:MAG: histidine--tRNA ligase [Planctomycetota bacterium]